MYTLLMKTHSGPRRQWALSERRLVIGRGRDCDLVVFDPLVSRRHCELWTDAGRVQFQDLGSANTTLVNGHETRGGSLGIGDEITIGDHAFVIAEAEHSEGTADRYDDGATPKTISIDDTPYFGIARKESAEIAGIGEFRSLVKHSRRFSQARNLSELCDTLLDVLRDEIKGRAAWIALFRRDSREVSIRAESATEGLPPPSDALAQVRRQRRGVLLPTDVSGSTALLMAAPLIVDDDVYGAVAIVVPPQTGDPEFHYFVALVHSFAPFYRSLERREQAARDFERDTGRAEISSALVGRSEAMASLRTLIEQVAGSDLNVLLLGETGVGKELVGRLIHNLSPRADRPYVVANCPAVPRELFESAFFGHRKGAFTGAGEHRDGYFAEAQGGTLFLDEIGDLPSDFQARLLRAVETRSYRPVGAAQDLRADLRIIAATNRPVDGRGANGTIRGDLFHRLAGFEITLPPLRERAEDVPDLAQHFLAEAIAGGRTRAQRLSAGALARLAEWDWPGNVRELRLCIERAGVLARGETIAEAEVTFWRGAEPQPDCPPANTSLEEIERWHFQRAFHHFRGNISAVAQSLKISRSTAYEKLRQFGIKE